MNGAKVLLKTGALEFDKPYPDGDMAQVRVKKSVIVANQDLVIWHRLGRPPNKVFIDWSSAFMQVKVSLDSNGREQADDEKIVVQFNSTGTAVVCIA